jgi:2-methylcitrate dehydratase
MGIATDLAKYSLGLKYADLPAEVVHEAKRALLDSIGCMIAAHDSEAATIVRKVIGSFGAAGPSSVVGGGAKTLPHYAALLNGVMLRFWDFNDTVFFTMGKMLSASHPSEIIPTCLALGEWRKIDGKELIASMVLGYELSGRFVRAIKNRPLENRGWNFDLLGAYIVPLVAGRLMELDVERIENAFGISGCRDMILEIVDASAETYTMTKNLRFPYTGHNGIIAAMLAKEGFTGPVRVLEGSRGFNEVVVGGDFDFSELTKENEYVILDNNYKPIVSNRSAQGHLSATLENARKHDIKPEDVERVEVFATARVAEHTGDPAKKFPHNKESADHSAYFLTAAAITDKALGLAQFTQEKYNDPVIKALIERVTIAPDASLDKFPAGGISKVYMKDGTVHETRIEYPAGSRDNPMTDSMMEEKFMGNATLFMSEGAARKAAKAIWDIDKCGDIGELMELLKF